MTRHLHVAAACNASYALALATMLASLTSNLGQSRIAHVYILQRDINDDLKKKIGDSINSERVKLCWINIDDGRLAPLKKTIRRFDTVSLESYYRLLLPEMLPPNLDKVIYLDCDLVVTRDLGELWDLDVEGTYLLASPELLPTSRFVSSSNGIRLYRELRLPDDLKFFNSGVMVINLRHWRDNYLCLRALIYILEAGQDLRWHDQEALNAVLAGEWRELDPTWNVTMHIFGRTLKPDLIPDLKNDPFIVHFNSAIKPWHPDFAFGFRDLFFHYLDMTAWSGWRPKAPRPLWIRASATIHRAAQKRQFSLARFVKNVGSKISNWRAVHRSFTQLDNGSIPSDARHEIRAFILAERPGPRLTGLLTHLWRLGIDRAFVVLENGNAADATALREIYGELHVFRGNSRLGPRQMVYRNLLHRYGEGHWCVLLNANELLYYPYDREISLKRLCRSFDDCGFDALSCQVVELVELGSSAEKSLLSDEDPDICDYQFSIDVERIDAVARDSFTSRVFPASVLVDVVNTMSGDEIRYRSKVALVKIRQGLSIADDLRAIGSGRLADCQGAVLCYKDGTNLESQRGRQCAPNHVRFTGVGQLAEIDVLRPNPILDALRKSSSPL